jgi:microcystin-dependent protein
MSNPYVGEIRLAAFNFAPQGWAFCDGSLLSISEYSTLFNLIGTTYGGDGVNNFALPNLLGRIPVHQGNGFTLAQNGGTETVTLTASQLPVHNHVPLASSGGGTSNLPTNNTWASWTGAPYIAGGASGNVAMSPNATSQTGGSQAHDNLMPYLAINFIISLFGIYPSQN